ncbi:uroporphyrinogen-III synthase [Anoxybacteroides amylolyticum]|uniref:Uroporphyrinogen-III synthase n=1 Tax=Anoxybacteroides amylolyticum TaxID=294699 RepID=A0A160F2T1_9BACL|nr:uroporphyrinogen-III synthase [Anoxybacillus amylolyticus]ANB60569.1 uroporphyrinogen-III synthase HemD family protein [Anoxybacillus amylolyticus]
MKHLPLSGKTVLVTREKEQARAFSEQLKKAGAIPLEIPLISVSAVSETKEIKECVRHLSRYDWLVFTSANGVRFFFTFIRDTMPLPNVAVVGKKTATALEKRGITPSVVPDEFIAEGLAEAMKSLVKPNDRVLLVKGNLARPALKESLVHLGADVTDLVVYETKMNDSSKAQLLDLLKKNAIDILTFTSPSTVESFMNVMNEIKWEPLLAHCVIACIGPVTKQAAENVGLMVHICPEQYTIDGMIKAMETFFQMEGKQ